jgi:hypothetical protein
MRGDVGLIQQLELLIMVLNLERQLVLPFNKPLLETEEALLKLLLQMLSVRDFLLLALQD